MNLSDIKLEKKEASMVTIDASQWLGEGLVLTFKQPDVPAIFGGMASVKKIQINHPDWHISLIESIAMLGNCHVSPSTGSISATDFYAKLAETEEDCFWHVLKAVNAGIPTLDAAAESAKNN